MGKIGFEPTQSTDGRFTVSYDSPTSPLTHIKLSVYSGRLALPYSVLHADAELSQLRVHFATAYRSTPSSRHLPYTG